jgi:hypothetical protein
VTPSTNQQIYFLVTKQLYFPTIRSWTLDHAATIVDGVWKLFWESQDAILLQLKTQNQDTESDRHCRSDAKALFLFWASHPTLFERLEMAISRASNKRPNLRRFAYVSKISPSQILQVIEILEQDHGIYHQDEARNHLKHIWMKLNAFLCNPKNSLYEATKYQCWTDEDYNEFVSDRVVM